MDGWMGKWLGGWNEGWKDGWMDGWMNGRMHGWMEGWVDGWSHCGTVVANTVDILFSRSLLLYVFSIPCGGNIG